MELRQLEYFVAVAEEASFTRAAKRVHISQSGVSAQIRQLERELGAPLIERAGRTATLTAAGAAAVGHARATLASADAVRRAVDDINGLIRGRVVLGMVTGCTVTPLFDAVAGFGLAHPGVELGLVEDASDRLTGRVRAGELDAALIGSAESSLAGLESTTIVRERLVAAVPVGHPLADQERVRLADVVRHPVVCMPEGTGIRTVLDAACAAQALSSNVVLQASAPAAVADLAVRGLGVAVLSESMLVGRDSLKVLSISDVEANTILALIWKPSPAAALRELIDRCQTAFAQQGDA
jgi:DNA-binding transcriptional LysR family regulator